LSYLAVFTSNVQYVRFAAGRRTQAGDATEQRRDQRNAATVCRFLIVTKFFVNKQKLSKNTDQMPMTSVMVSPRTGRRKCTSKQNVL